MAESLRRMGSFMRRNGKKQTVVITGASAGLGRAIALAYAGDGARIGLIARDRERLEAVKEEVSYLGTGALCDRHRRSRRSPVAG